MQDHTTGLILNDSRNLKETHDKIWLQSKTNTETEAFDNQ